MNFAFSVSLRFVRNKRSMEAPSHLESLLVVCCLKWTTIQWVALESWRDYDRGSSLESGTGCYRTGLVDSRYQPTSPHPRTDGATFCATILPRFDPTCETLSQRHTFVASDLAGPRRIRVGPRIMKVESQKKEKKKNPMGLCESVLCVLVRPTNNKLGEGASPTPLPQLTSILAVRCPSFSTLRKTLGSISTCKFHLSLHTSACSSSTPRVSLQKNNMILLPASERLDRCRSTSYPENHQTSVQAATDQPRSLDLRLSKFVGSADHTPFSSTKTSAHFPRN